MGNNLLLVIVFLNMTISYRIDLKYDEIPADMRVESEERRQELIEHVSNVDDVLGELFLGNSLHNKLI